MSSYIRKTGQNLQTSRLDTTRLSIGNDSLKFEFISSKSDLPSPSGGVITLLEETTYFFIGNIDLTGDRLITSQDTVILGSSSENSSITSTGLGDNIPLITIGYTCPIRHITFRDVHTALDITDNSSTALDWTGVNILNVPNIGTVGDNDNFIYTKGAFLNSKNLIVRGEIGTLAFNNSLLQGDGEAGDIIKIENTASITRRFRIIYSSIIAFSSTNGINVDASSNIPNEGFILDTVNFSGGSDYLPGIDNTDNKSLFVNCTGIVNTDEICQYYMNGNSTTTVITSTGVEVKIAGNTTESTLTQKFTNGTNRATYLGSKKRFFKATASLSCNSGNNNQIGIYFSKNGTIIADSEIYITTNGSGRAESSLCQTLVELEQNDYIEVWVENNTSTNNILVTELNVIIQ